MGEGIFHGLATCSELAHGSRFGAGVLARSQAQKPLMSRPSLPDCVVWDNGTWGIYVDGVRVAYNVYLAGTPDLEDGLLEDGALYTANDSGAAQFRSFSTTMTYLCDASHYTLGGCAGTASWITNNSNWNASLPTP